jgi:hypothetical protein
MRVIRWSTFFCSGHRVVVDVRFENVGIFYKFYHFDAKRYQMGGFNWFPQDHRGHYRINPCG